MKTVIVTKGTQTMTFIRVAGGFTLRPVNGQEISISDDMLDALVDFQIGCYQAEDKTVNNDWNVHWRSATEDPPALYEKVIVKTLDNKMSVDWLEPFPSVDAHLRQVQVFSENFGVPHVWMPKDVWDNVAPQWAKNELIPEHISIQEGDDHEVR